MPKKVFVPPSQAIDHFTIAPSDTVNFVDDSTNNTEGYQMCSGIFVGTGGNVAVVMAGGKVKTYNNIANGSFLPIACIRVNSTNTTASNMLALISQGS